MLTAVLRAEAAVREKTCKRFSFSSVSLIIQSIVIHLTQETKSLEKQTGCDSMAEHQLSEWCVRPQPNGRGGEMEGRRESREGQDLSTVTPLESCRKLLHNLPNAATFEYTSSCCGDCKIILLLLLLILHLL